VVRIEHLRPEREPGPAVLEQIAEAVGVGLYGHAGQRAQRIEEDLLDLVRMDVDLHAERLSS
jgi:hypothetical protein